MCKTKLLYCVGILLRFTESGERVLDENRWPHYQRGQSPEGTCRRKARAGGRSIQASVASCQPTTSVKPCNSIGELSKPFV